MPPRLLATYAPGTNPQLAPAGTAFRLEPGGILELQMHYTTTGEAATDRTRVGLVLATEPSPREIRASHFFNATLRLPPGAAAVPVETDLEFLQPTTVWDLFPHTHLRGKNWEYKLVLPDGTARAILSVPRYDSTGRPTTYSPSRSRFRRAPGSSRPRGTTTPPPTGRTPIPQWK